MSVITLGTMAFDAIETPFGKIDKIVGGSATYVAYAASHLVKPVQQISIVGSDFPVEEMAELKKRGVELDGVQIIADQKSFFWSGKYHLDMNTRDTLITDLNVLADFKPVVPDSYQNAEFLMLGNLMPLLQISVIKQLKTRPKLIVLDTMNFWMEIALDDLKAVLKKVDVLMVNDGEARQFTRGVGECDGELDCETAIDKFAHTTDYAFCFSHAANSVTVLTAATDGLDANNAAECAP